MPKNVISFVAYTMKGKRFLLFPNHLRLLYSNLKSSALLLAFHCSRHTFGTMMLTLGVDLYTVSKLLGHTKVETTQIYAKIINKKKDDAVSLIDDAFSDMEF